MNIWVYGMFISYDSHVAEMSGKVLLDMMSRKCTML
jgi:hypothetical protein